MGHQLALCLELLIMSSVLPSQNQMATHCRMAAVHLECRLGRDRGVSKVCEQ